MILFGQQRLSVLVEA